MVPTLVQHTLAQAAREVSAIVVPKRHAPMSILGTRRDFIKVTDQAIP